MDNFTKDCEFCKVDDALGLVFGYAIVCNVDGEPYYDLQGDHITEKAMLDAACDFMLHARVAKDMHDKNPDRPGQQGTVVFAWPMTAEIAKAFDLDVKHTGLMIAMKPNDPHVLKEFRDGKRTGFSIGGTRIADQEEFIDD